MRDKFGLGAGNEGISQGLKSKIQGGVDIRAEARNYLRDKSNAKGLRLGEYLDRF